MDEQERIDLETDEFFDSPEADALDARVAETIVELTRLRDEVARHRPWLFLPGDKVLVLLDEVIYSGVVQQIQIPSPMGEQFPEYIVQVRLDDGSQFGGAVPWCNPDQVELIRA